MSGILEHILARRSVRRFQDRALGPSEITPLLQAAMAAPSASNRRPWEFVVLTEEDRLRQLRRRLPFGRYRAPAAIIVCGNLRRAYPWPARDFWIEDCSAATENILLCATGLGLGAVWIGVYPLKPLVGAVSRLLGLPRHVVPLGVVHVGYPAETPPPRTQYNEARVHWQSYA
ncbi:MAG: nitroreductase family protein [Anaerolineae bacterium]|nr:nitroreductase family protein [Anaerolineae bacterium]